MLRCSWHCVPRRQFVKNELSDNCEQAKTVSNMPMPGRVNGGL